MQVLRKGTTFSPDLTVMVRWWEVAARYRPPVLSRTRREGSGAAGRFDRWDVPGRNGIRTASRLEADARRRQLCRVV